MKYIKVSYFLSIIIVSFWTSKATNAIIVDLEETEEKRVAMNKYKPYFLSTAENEPMPRLLEKLLKLNHQFEVKPCDNLEYV